MSFGYSIGDFIGGANLTYQLIRVLKDTRGASLEYQEAMLELSAMQQAFLQVIQMSRNAIIPQATINSASHIVMSAMDIISGFLEKSRTYQKRLGGSGVRNSHELSPLDLGDSWAKIGWALFKKDELKQLRDSLHSRLSSIQLLLSASAYSNPIPQEMYQYRLPLSQEEARFATSLGNSFAPTSGVTSPVAMPPRFRIADRHFQGSGNSTPDTRSSHGVGMPNSPSTSSRVSQDSLPLRSAESVPQIRSSPSAQEAEGQINHPDSASFSESSTEAANGIGFNRLTLSSTAPPSNLRIPIPISLDSESQVNLTIAERMQHLSEKWLGDLTLQGIPHYMIAEFQVMLSAGLGKVAKHLPPVKLKDAVGRKFSFPFHLVATWGGMEELLNQAFLQVETLNEHVKLGHYDILGQDGEIILPQVWEKCIEPGMSLSMTMWPIEKLPSPLLEGPSEQLLATN